MLIFEFNPNKHILLLSKLVDYWHTRNRGYLYKFVFRGLITNSVRIIITATQSI